MESSIAARVEENLEDIRTAFRAAGVVLAYLFGSAARRLEKADSDLDVAVLFGREVPQTRYGEIRVRLLTELVGLTHTNDVDLVILNSTPPLLSYQVISTGQLLLGSQTERVRFELDAVKRYIDTRPLRAYLAKALKRRVSEEPPRERSSGRW